MNKKLMFVTAAAVFAGLLILVGVTYAQSNDPQAAGQPGAGYGRGRMGNGYGMGMGQTYTGTMPGGPGMMFGRRGGWADGGATGPMHDAMMTILAGALGLTPDELDSRLEAGETPHTIALEQGLTSEQFFEIMQGARSAAIEKLVADGALTREQAEWMLGHMGGRGFGGNCPHGVTRTSP